MWLQIFAQAYFYSVKTAFRVSEIVLPEANDLPTKRAQVNFYTPIPSGIFSQFKRPKKSIGRRSSSVLGAAVPKAPIDKNGEALPLEDEIGAAWDWLVAPPSSNTCGTKNGGQFQLGGFIATRADCGHYLRALMPGIDICHYGQRRVLWLLNLASALRPAPKIATNSRTLSLAAMRPTWQAMTSA